MDKKTFGFIVDTVDKYNKAVLRTHGRHAFKRTGDTLCYKSLQTGKVFAGEELVPRLIMVAQKMARHFESDKALHRKWSAVTCHKWHFMGRGDRRVLAEPMVRQGRKERTHARKCMSTYNDNIRPDLYRDEAERSGSLVAYQEVNYTI